MHYASIKNASRIGGSPNSPNSGSQFSSALASSGASCATSGRCARSPFSAPLGRQVKAQGKACVSTPQPWVNGPHSPAATRRTLRRAPNSFRSELRGIGKRFGTNSPHRPVLRTGRCGVSRLRVNRRLSQGCARLPPSPIRASARRVAALALGSNLAPRRGAFRSFGATEVLRPFAERPGPEPL